MSLSALLPALALVAALLLTPITSLVARRNGWVDQPGLRKIHREPIPYLGGAAVLGAVLLALLLGPWLPLVSDTEVTLDRRLLAVLLGAALSLAASLVLHLRTQPARRVAAEMANARVSELMAGRLHIAEVTHLTPFVVHARNVSLFERCQCKESKPQSKGLNGACKMSRDTALIPSWTPHLTPS